MFQAAQTQLAMASARAPTAGSVNENVAPRSEFCSARSLPPCASMIDRLMAGPSDERLDRDDAHEPVVISQSLVDAPSKPLETAVFLGARLQPGIAQYNFRISERQQRIAWHVSPALAVAGGDQRVENRL